MDQPKIQKMFGCHATTGRKAKLLGPVPLEADSLINYILIVSFLTSVSLSFSTYRIGTIIPF